MNQQSKNHLNSWLILIGAFVICGIISVLMGKELCWDLANYHYYNPFSFLNQRWKQDFWPSSYVHIHLNPTIDFLSYFLINHFSTVSILFIMGGITGINFWLLFNIASIFLEKNYCRTPIALSLAFLGLFGPTALPGLGSFQNDNLVSIFVLAFFYIQCKIFINYIPHRILPTKSLVLSGVLLGVAAGLKLTASVFIIGAFSTFIILPITFSQKIKLILLCSVGALCGYSIFSGYWLLHLWQQYQNPFFPFYNAIFHSPFFPNINLKYTMFFPHNWQEAIFFPFYFSFDKISEIGFHDYRYPIVFVLFVATGCIQIIHVVLKKSQIIDKVIFFSYSFFIFSYISWECFFSIARYIVVLEMLTPLFIYLLVTRIIHRWFITVPVLVLLYSILIFAMKPIQIIRVPWYENSYLNVVLPEFIQHIPKAMVLSSYPAYAFYLNPRPLSYLVPFFPSEWHFVGIPFAEKKFIMPSQQDYTMILKSIEHFDGNIYLLSSESHMAEFYRAIKPMKLVPAGPCAYIVDDRQRISKTKTQICPVVKVSTDPKSFVANHQPGKPR